MARKKENMVKREKIWRKYEMEKAKEKRAKNMLFSSLPFKAKRDAQNEEEKKAISIKGLHNDSENEEEDLLIPEKPSYFSMADEI